jgi:hypothetical protein
MSGIVTIQPIAVSSGGGGNYGSFAIGGGAPTAVAALTDDDDATYVYANGMVNATGAMRFDLENILLPNGAQVRAIRANARCAQNPGTAKVLGYRIHSAGYVGSVIDWTETNYAALTTVPTTYTGPWETNVYNGAITPDVLSHLSIEFFVNTATADIALYELWAEVYYDDGPEVAIVAPAGTITDTATPKVTWTYTDADNVAQNYYTVEVRDAADALVYTSGDVLSATPYHQILNVLPSGSYTARVRASKSWFWGFYWSPWDYQTFTIAVQPLGTPQLTAVARHGYIEVEVQHSLNLMSHAESSSGLGTSEWSILSGISAIARYGTIAHWGEYSNKVTLSTTGVASVRRDTARIAAREDQEYLAYGYFRSDTSMAAAQTAMGIAFYDSNNTLISSSVGDYVVENVGTLVQTWVTPSHRATAPADTRYVAPILIWNGGISGQTHLFDDIQLLMTDEDFGDPNPGRGGGLYEQDAMGTIVPHLYTMQGRNVLARRDANVDTDATWHAATVGDVPTVSATQSRYGDRSLSLTRTGSTGHAIAYAPSIGWMPVTPGEKFALYASIRAGSTSRTVRMSMRFFNSNLTEVASAMVEGTDSSAAWTDLSVVTGTSTTPTDDGGVAALVPAGATYAGIWPEVDACPAAEIHYFGRMAVYKLDKDSPVREGWKEGLPPGTTGLALVTVEYYEATDVDPQWRALRTIEVNPLYPTITVQDWDAAHGSERKYRAYTWRYYDGVGLKSSMSAEALATLYINHTWLSRLDGVGHNFMYDGGDARNDNRKQNHVLTHYSGRQYPMAETGEDRDRTVAVTLTLATTEDMIAFDTFTRIVGPIIYRDWRGRRMRGIIDSPQVTDATGIGQVATFNILVAGDQSVRDQALTVTFNEAFNSGFQTGFNSGFNSGFNVGFGL